MTSPIDSFRPPLAGVLEDVRVMNAGTVGEGDEVLEDDNLQGGGLPRELFASNATDRVPATELVLDRDRPVPPHVPSTQAVRFMEQLMLAEDTQLSKTIRAALKSAVSHLTARASTPARNIHECLVL